MRRRLHSGGAALALAMVVSAAACGGVSVDGKGTGGSAGKAISTMDDDPPISTGTGGASSPGGPGKGSSGGKPGGFTGTTGGKGGQAPQGGSAGQGGGVIGQPCATSVTCPSGGFCKAGVCTCPADKPDVCGATDACVSRLSDPNNCGECGTSCELGAACDLGTCGAAPVDLVSAEGCGSIRLAVYGKSLYFTESASGRVLRTTTAGGEPTVLATGQLSPTQIAADATGVYWLNHGDGSSQVMKKALPLTDGPPLVLKNAPADEGILAIALSNGKLYYASGHDVHAISTDEADASDVIVGTATNYDLNPPTGEPSGEPAGLAICDGIVVWTTHTRQGVERDDVNPGNTGYVELGESQGSLLHSDIGCSDAFGVSAVYWANGESVVQADPGQLANRRLTGTLEFDPITALAVGGGSVYFAGANGLVWRHGQAFEDPEQPPSALAFARGVVTSLVLDASSVYFATDGCAIRRTPL